MTEEEHAVVEAMERHGGSFIRNLAALYRSADANNKKRIRSEFRDYWKAYVIVKNELSGHELNATSHPVESAVRN